MVCFVFCWQSTTFSHWKHVKKLLARTSDILKKFLPCCQNQFTTQNILHIRKAQSHCWEFFNWLKMKSNSFQYQAHSMMLPSFSSSISTECFNSKSIYHVCVAAKMDCQLPHQTMQNKIINIDIEEELMHCVLQETIHKEQPCDLNSFPLPTPLLCRCLHCSYGFGP